MNRIIALFLSLVSVYVIEAQVLPAPATLSVEFLRSPGAAVITDASPEFSWEFPQSGIKQSAYQILTATSPYLLNEARADCRNSGKIMTSQSVNVPYRGKELEANSIYWWQVKVWSETDLESSYSQPQQFITGSFDRSDLDYPGQSRWIELASNQWVSEDKQSASFEKFDPVSVEYQGNERIFVDFGKAAIGILEFTATSARNGLPLTIHLGERKTDNQIVHKDPGRSNIGYEKVELSLKKGTHRYIAEIPEREITGYLHSQKLAPHLPEVMPFRYVEILGDLKIFRLSNIRQGGLFYYFDEDASHFQCSDERLKTVWDLCKYTQKATPFLGVYADGNRERMPYEADAHIQQMSHFAVDREYSISRYTINFLLNHASWPTEWQMHMVLMAWDYYMQTGDEKLLADRYEDLRLRSLIALTDDSGLISTRTGKKTEAFLRSLNYPGSMEKFRDIVDWPHGVPNRGRTASHQSPLAGGETDGFVFTDYNAVVNAFHYRSLVLMARIAEVVGNRDDQVFFNERAAAHLEIFLSAFFNEEKKIFKDGISTDHSSLHANMFPLAFNMVPEDDISTVAEFVKSRGMACSVYGSQFLLDALYNAGEAEHALQLMTSDSKRSWLNMIRVGSSMTTEAWDEYFKPNLTWNHAWGSAPANIVSRKLIGIEPLEPSFTRFRVNPQPGSLEEVSVKVPCIRGPVKCDLSNGADSWEIMLSIPGNSEAEVWLPERFNNVSIEGKRTRPVRTENFAQGTRNIFVLKSGVFHISARE